MLYSWERQNKFGFHHINISNGVKMTKNSPDSNIKSFQSKRIVSHHVEKIKAAPERIFPLLCPIQEYKWIDGWQCEMVYSDSGAIESNCVFKEEKTSPLLFDLPAPTYWMTSLYDPEEYRIQFVLLTGTMAVAKIDVEVQGLGGTLSSITWTFTITSLNDEANKIIGAAAEQKAKLLLSILGQSLKHYCETEKLFLLNGANLVKMGLSTNLIGLLKSHLSRLASERR
jgi:hypothetical protein